MRALVMELVEGDDLSQRIARGAIPIGAEAASFDVLITTDKNMRYQQNLTRRAIAIILLGNAQWSVLRMLVAHVVTAVAAATPGSFTEVDIPVD